MDSCNRSSAKSTVGAAEKGVSSAPLLAVRIDRKSFAAPRTGRARLVLDRLELVIQPGELLAVVSPSGRGKSTLLHLIAGLDEDFEGGINWSDGVAPRLGFCFQSPRLLPWLSLRGNLDLVLENRVAQAPRVEALLRTMGLGEVGHFPANRLSVGMQRRAALARAFAVDPEILLMDEPFVSLDAPTAEQLRRLLLELCAEQHPAVCFVTHELREATLLADRILFLSSPPTRVIRTARVEIRRAQRLDSGPIAARHAELQELFQTLYAGGGSAANA